MPEPIPEVQSAGSYGDLAPIAVAAAREGNTFRKVRLVQESRCSPIFPRPTAGKSYPRRARANSRATPPSSWKAILATSPC